MWPRKPVVLNDKRRIDDIYRLSVSFLENRSDVCQRLAQHLWGFHEACDLIPQTESKFASGHYFPIAEAYSQVECAYELTLEGFYRQALSTLRWVLELGLLQVFFSVDDREEHDIQPWLTGSERTPARRKLFARLAELPSFVAFDREFGFGNRILETFDRLDAFAHTRGGAHSGFGLAGTNVVAFSEKALLLCVETLASVTRHVITALLLKYPIGLQPLPLDQKYGFFGPMGGWLQDHQVQLLRSLLDPEEAEHLQQLSDEDVKTQELVRYIEDLPDLPRDEWERQSSKIDRWMEASGQPRLTPEENSPGNPGTDSSRST